MSFAIIPQNLSIKAMRSSGYKDSAYAIAELIDNSVQAGEGCGRPVDVELICVDQVAHETGSRRRLHRLAVYDNACGMSPDTLRKALQFGVGTHMDAAAQDGIGKFGMGLPNSSISQCRRVDVWSWQQGRVFHTYLDLDEIDRDPDAQVPKPEERSLPENWMELVSGEVFDSGTLVVWTQLDLMRWKQSTALLRNAEFIIGRVYRYFIDAGRARIRLAAYEDVGGRFRNTSEGLVRPNDPMFLMSGTSAPGEFATEPAFEAFGEPQELMVSHGGVVHTVTLSASICKTATRKLTGNSPIGSVAAKNLGVSVVRASRELELNRSFENHYDPRERWWGIEVSFEPGLDAVFGVTNNKQAATEFKKMSLDDDAAAEDMSVADYEEQLKHDADPRWPMYELSKMIDSLLSTMRSQIKRMREAAITSNATTGGGGPTAESIATRALRRRQERLGETGTSDADERAAEAERTRDLSTEIQSEGVEPARAREIAVDYVQRRIKFRFRHADFPGFSVFDITSRAGVIIITINTRHPAHRHLFELLREEEENVPENPALQGLKLLLTAWARMEDEASADRKVEFEDTRGEWGRIARDFIREADE